MKKLVNENCGLLVFVVLMVLFRSAVADWNDVPTGSMQPTIRIGDRILIDKLAYDFRVPFTHISLVELGDPKRGDIVVFDSNVSGKRLVKRVIGVPGDTVAMQNNRLIINGNPIEYVTLSRSGGVLEKLEFLPEAEHRVKSRASSSPYANFAPVTVPQERYLVLGDNRDNSVDSRVIGLVPRAEIIGKSEKVVVSLDYSNYFLPRTDRWWKPLN